MAQYGGFFNSSDTKKRQYVDLDFARMLSLLTGGEGCISGYGNELEVTLGEEAEIATEGSKSKINVKTGAAWVGEPAGWWYINGEQKTLDIDLISSTGMDRIDWILLRLDRTTTELQFSLDVVKGTDEPSPAVGEYSLVQENLEEDGHIYEIPLAQVYVTGGSTTLTVTDKRCMTYSWQPWRKIDNGNATKDNDFTLSISDMSCFVRCNNSSGITITVPANDTVAIPEASDITLWQEGAGKITVLPASGVTIYADGQVHDSPGETIRSFGQYEGFTLRKIDVDSWVAVGAITSDEA